MKSTDGGQSWTSQPSGTSQQLYSVSCATPADCVAVGGSGTVRTTDGGLAWDAQPPPTTDTLIAVSCSTALTCTAVGDRGVAATTVTGGRSWAVKHLTGATQRLLGVSCPSATHCIAAGDGGLVFETLDNGGNWSLQSSGTTEALRAVSCATDADCWITSATTGKIITNSAAATLPRPDVACQSSSTTTVSDGYVAGPTAYLGLKADEPAANVTDVCWQFAAGAVNSSGVIRVTGASLGVVPPQVDQSGSACLAQGGDVVVSNTNGLGTVRVSRFVGTGEAWVCVEAPGVSYRLKLVVPSATTPNVDVGASDSLPPPAPKPWPAKASARCQATSGTFLADTELVGHQLWVATATGAGQAQVCVRHEDGSGAGNGGVVTVNPAGLPAQFGMSSDLSPCTDVVDHFSAPPAKLDIDKSPGTNPQSVCIDAGLYRQRFYVGTGAGAPVTFEADS